MNRRRFLKSTTALAAMAAASRAPALAQPANARVLRYVPTGDPGSIDPIWTTNYETRNHGYLIYDTLFATGANFTIKPQMAEGADVSADGKTWTIRLREGLKFHDGEPVRARDCIASLSRWSKRDSFGQTWAANLAEMRAGDDRTIVCRLKAPFPAFLQAIGKLSSNVAFIMPERVANTDAMQQITDTTGCGPYMFVRDEFRAGARLVYARNPNYVPRSDASDWAAGAKVAHFERIEWSVIPDAATSAAAIQSGETDWLEEVQPDTVPVVRRNRNVKVEIASARCRSCASTSSMRRSTRSPSAARSCWPSTRATTPPRSSAPIPSSPIRACRRSPAARRSRARSAPIRCARATSSAPRRRCAKPATTARRSCCCRAPTSTTTIPRRR
jgi:peptide/nickel transport system substrate-binding protein